MGQLSISAVLGALSSLVIAAGALAPRARAEEAVALRPLVSPGGYAIARHVLSTGAVVQLSSGCSEWMGGGLGFVVLPATSEGAEPVAITFPSGPFFEGPGRLVVAAHAQVGSDGTDEPPLLPPGCAAPFTDATGSTYCTQVLAVDLDTGATGRTPWDTFAPAGTPEGTFVVVASTSERTGFWQSDGRPAEALWLWNPGSGLLDRLGSASGPPRYRVVGDEIFAALSPDSGARFVAVDTRSGRVRDVTAAEAALPETAWSPPVAAPAASPAPGEWVTPTGRPVRIEGVGGALVAPTTGGCGVDGVYFAHGLVFVDEGAFFWPEGLLAP